MQSKRFIDPTATLQQQRTSNMFELQCFPRNELNMLDRPLDELFNMVKEKMKASLENQIAWENLKTKNPEGYAIYLTEVSKTDEEICHMLSQEAWNVSYMLDELNALAEVRIIYAFKHLEIQVKRLLKEFYPETDARYISNWDAILTFVRSKGIDLITLKNYEKIDQLRKVNNALKHEGDLTEKIKKIAVFSCDEDFDYANLSLFYASIKEAPMNFLESLCDAVFEERYSFNDDKLHKIADSFVLRMDKETAQQFAAQLLKRFDDY